MLTHFSLFTGIGGIDLAAERAGFKSVGQCEIEDYPTKVLEKHWPDVPRWRDIRDVTAESFKERAGLDTVTLISGGFPCQPFSVAGKQRGKEDDRYLWPEMCRVIKELRPTWVLGENVAGIVRMALDTVLSDLEAQGYITIPFIIPACGVDAQHRRERVFILAHSRQQSEGAGSYRPCCKQQHSYEKKLWAAQGDRSANSSEVAANSTGERLQGQGESVEPINPTQDRYGKASQSLNVRIGNQWATEPDVGRVAHGIPNRVDRLKCLGNAVVPQQVYPVLKAIAQIELKEEI